MSSNNPIHLNEQLRQLIEWLNVIVLGGENDGFWHNGVFKPSNEKSIADRFGALQAMVNGRVAYETKAQLEAAGSPPADKPLAEVWNDPLESNNGLYGWNGVAWEKSPYDKYETVLGVVGSLSDSVDGRIADMKVNAGVIFAITDALGNAALTVKDDGSVAIESATVNTLLQRAIELGNSGIMESGGSNEFGYGVTDEEGNVALGVKKTGEVILPGDLSVNVEKSNYLFAITDSDGNAVLTIDKSGRVDIPALIHDSAVPKDVVTLDNIDSIAIVGDSHTESIWTLKDKAYISVLSMLSDYKFYNFGISGNDVLDMTYRIVNRVPYFDGATFSDFNARYCFVCDRDNDGYMFKERQAYWQQNITRLLQAIRANGAEPIVCTEFSNTATETALMKVIAQKERTAWVDNAKNNHELGRLQTGAFHQGHPGTRTNGVFWVEMYNYLRTLPRPEKSIKIFRRRPSFPVSHASDLLYHDVMGRAEKFQELSVTHNHLSEASKVQFEELNQSGFSHVRTMDEYWQLRQGQAVNFSDYGLIEFTLPGTASTIEKLIITLPDLPENCAVFVRNILDRESGLPGKNLGGKILPSDSEYQAKWSRPVGAWRSLSATGQTFVIDKSQISESMLYDKVQLLVHHSDGFALKAPSVAVFGELGKVSETVVDYQPSLSEQELLTYRETASLEGWQITGSPSVVTPIDGYNCPRKPEANVPIDTVVTVTEQDRVAQFVSLPVATSQGKTYALTAWARHFPKAYLDNSRFNFDPSQVVDRVNYPDFDVHSPVTETSFDFRRLRCEWDFSAAMPSRGGIVSEDMVGLAWRSVTFYVYQAPAPLGKAALFFELSCPDGEIQIAKISLKEVLNGNSY